MILTERLSLQPLEEADRDAHAAMMADPEVMHDYPAPMIRAQADGRFDNHRAAFARDGFGKWTVRRRADGAYLGFTGVSPLWPHLPPAPGLEIGWRLVRAAWGEGYASEAARASLRDIFQRTAAEEVIAYTHPTNERSQAVMRRLGFRREPTRDFEQAHDRSVVYVTDRADWITAST